MRTMQSLLKRVRSLFTREASNLALKEELEFHLDQATAANLARGMSPREARAEAQRSFGSIAEATASSYASRGVTWLDDLAHDTRYALRTFTIHRSFALLTVLTLALGIGACTAIFSLVDAVLLHSLPYGDTGRLVYLFTPNPRFALPPDVFAPTKADFVDLKKENRSFAGMTQFEQATYNIAAGEQTSTRGVAKVDEDFFQTLAVKPLFGRLIDATDQGPGKDRAVVISYALWQDLFAGASNVLGKPLLLDGAGYAVVGVMPPEFAYPHKSDISAANGRIDRTDLWIPLALTPEQKAQRSNAWGYVLARLKANVTLREAQAEMSTLMARLNLLHDASDHGWGAYVESFRDAALGPVRPLMWLLLGAVGMVLLISCGNAANLLLARAAQRKHEMGVRATLGAGRTRLLRQMLTESLLLSVAAGVAGTGLAWLFLHGLLRLNPRDIPRMAEATLNLSVFSFLAAVTLLTSLFFGVIPAFLATRINLAAFLQGSGTRGLVGDRKKVRSTLAVLQVALVVVLLTGAGLMLRSYAKVLSTPMGFSPSTITASVLFSPEIAQLPQSPQFRTAATRKQFVEEALNRFSRIPGVRAAGAVDVVPLSHWEVLSPFEVEGYANEKGQMVEKRLITPGYFSAMQIPVILGRGMTEDDLPGRARAVVINEEFARKYFGTVDALGHRIRTSAQDQWATVTGVVGNVRMVSREAPAAPQIYFPFWQGDLDTAPANGADFAVRSSLPPDVVIGQLRAAMRAVDPHIALANVHTMSEVESGAAARRRFQATLLAVFSVVAMLLAVIGVYGLMAFSVRQRTGEIGLRMALGATRADVIQLVLREGLTLLAVGLCLGILAAALLSRLVAGFLYEVPALDPLTYTLVPLLLFVATIAACLVPSARAAGIDPMSALRHE